MLVKSREISMSFIPKLLSPHKSDQAWGVDYTKVAKAALAYQQENAISKSIN